MNNQNPNPNPSPAPSTPPAAPTDSGEQRRAERAPRQDARWQGYPMRRHSWLWGMILVVLGTLFLLQNLGFRFLTNWWSLFILVPAFWAYFAAWDTAQQKGRLTRRAVTPLTLGVVLTILAVILLLGMAVGMLWPIFLIAGGLALLLTGLLPE